MKSIVLFSTVFLCCFSQSNAYPKFAKKIPNGANVQHPCKPNTIWKGVGHHYAQGGGKRNQFGLDFLKFGRWTRELCQMDSDGDSVTNGEELGDPNCVWVEGAVPSRGVNITHPGVCSPTDSQKCKQLNTSFIDCNVGDFYCPAINETETFNRTVRYPETEVPERVTSYYCMYFDFPTDDDYHLVATQPVLGNKNVIHHVLVYGCNNKTSEKNITLNEPKKCGMFDWNCQDIVALWTVGVDGECSHNDTGFRIGTNGYKRAMMQVQWNNPDLISNYTDNSGITFFFQPKQRPYDSGVLMVGQFYLEIHPEQQRFTTTGKCYEECTRTAFTKPFNVTRGLNHMHYLGRQEKMELYRNHTLLRDIAFDEVYSYDSPEPHTFENPIVVNPGDEIKITCVYESIHKNRTTFFGQATADEMCLGFLTYYPKESVTRSVCGSLKSIPYCKMNPPQTVQNCSLKDVYDYMKSPMMMSFAYTIYKSCEAFGQCTTKCKEALKQYKDFPCLVGDVGDLLRRTMSRNKQASLLILAIDSCKIDNYKEKHNCTDGYTIHMPSSSGCSLEKFGNKTSETAIKLRADVKMYCKKLYTCLPECLQLLTKYPCLHKESADALKAKAISDKFYYDIFAGLDSCKLEFFKTVSSCPIQLTQPISTTTSVIVGTIDVAAKNKLSAYSLLVTSLIAIVFYQR